MSVKDAAGEAAVYVRVDPQGGLRVEFAARPPLVLSPIAANGAPGWSMGSGTSADRVVPGPARLGGHVLLDGDGEELARTTPLGGPDAGETTILLADGRAFRLRATIGSAGGAVLSWETPSPYVTIAPDGVDGWVLTATAAGRELGWDRNLLALIAAELAATRRDDDG